MLFTSNRMLYVAHFTCDLICPALMPVVWRSFCPPYNLRSGNGCRGKAELLKSPWQPPFVPVTGSTRTRNGLPHANRTHPCEHRIIDHRSLVESLRIGTRKSVQNSPNINEISSHNTVHSTNQGKCSRMTLSYCHALRWLIYNFKRLEFLQCYVGGASVAMRGNDEGY